MSEDVKDTPMPQEGEDKTKENEVNSDDKDLKSALAQKEHFREKVEKLEKEAEELRAKVEKAQGGENKPQPKNESTDVDSLKERLAKIEFSQAHPEIDSSDIEEIFKLAGLNNQDPNEVLEKNDMVKTYLEKKATDKKVQNATPDVSRSGVARPEKPVSEMSREEHMEWAKKIMGA